MSMKISSSPSILRIVSLSIMIVLLASTVSCSIFRSNYLVDSDLFLCSQVDENVVDYPEMKFIVISDPHLYDKSNGIEGSAFTEYLANDRKLLKESEEILQEFISASSQIDVDFVLVSGDLTKDGEKNSHLLMASYLREIEKLNNKVYVIPGNHDILNGLAEKFSGDQVKPVDNVTPLEFSEIYADYGFVEALYADSSSLSYIVEPVEGLWLFALDSNRYDENEPGKEHIIDGKFKDETIRWLEDKLLLAAREKKAVIVMMHHGILEHYQGQEKYYGEYIVDDFKKVSKLLARYNARLVFTGHYHAQDITVTRCSDYDKFLFDIETGSLITYPNPFRIISITDTQKLIVHSNNITSIAGHSDDFPTFAYQYAHEGIQGIASRTVQNFKANPEESNSIGSQVADAFLAHYAGDEHIEADKELLRTTGLSVPARLVVTFRKGLVEGLWQDLEPPDNELEIDLKTGQWVEIP